jgi:hypothetical protein
MAVRRLFVSFGNERHNCRIYILWQSFVVSPTGFEPVLPT